MEKRIIDYIVKAESDPAKLARDVSEMLKLDYQPYGSPCENGGGVVWQAMVKYDQGDPDRALSRPTPMYKGTPIE